MNSQKLTGVILAAGRGTRMGVFSEVFPKPILPICNRPLIEHHIDILKNCGVTDILILIGHRGFEIAKLLGSGERLGVKITYVEQTQMLGIAHAVGRVEPFVKTPFLLFLGDIFFIPRNLRHMIELFHEQGGGAVLATKEEADPLAIRKNFSITLSPEGLVTRVVEKPRYTTNRLKGVGIYLFDLTVFDAIRRTPRTAMRDEYEITETIQVLIDDGYPIRTSNAIDDDINLTTPADLLRCNLLQARKTPPELLIGSHCTIHPHATLKNSVIGKNVNIPYPIEIRDSVVFDNATVNVQVGFDHCIVTPEYIVECKYGMPIARLSTGQVYKLGS